jgi:hypothetical protein
MAMMGSVGFAQATPVPREIVGKKVKRGLFNDRAMASQDALQGRKGAAMTCAQQKRNSTKRRNQQRHKRHCRG